MRKQIIGVLGALALALGFAGPAGAASSVDITYELSDTTILSGFQWTPCPAEGCSVRTQLLGGSMKISYSSDSASSMPILHGPATLQSLVLSAQIGVGAGYDIESAHVNVDLVSPVTGSLLSGGTLTFGTAQIRVTGSQHCFGREDISGFCIVFVGTLTSIDVPLGPYTDTTTLSFAAPVGPYGGARSTRHTVSGAIPMYVPSRFAQALSLTGYELATGANLVGREILREAEGHDPKVIPEPGTLLLLGAGTAGLALVGRATRRARQG